MTFLYMAAGRDVLGGISISVLDNWGAEIYTYENMRESGPYHSGPTGMPLDDPRKLYHATDAIVRHLQENVLEISGIVVDLKLSASVIAEFPGNETMFEMATGLKPLLSKLAVVDVNSIAIGTQGYGDFASYCAGRDIEFDYFSVYGAAKTIFKGFNSFK